MPVQRMVIELDGMCAADYLAWLRDPEPPLLGVALRSVVARNCGGSVDVELDWNVEPPEPQAAVRAAGFPLPAGAVLRRGGAGPASHPAVAG